MADDFKAVDLTKVYDDTISTRPFDLTDDSEHQSPKYISGEELSNMTRIDSSWKNPQFKIPSALDANNIRGADLTKPEEFAATFVRAATDTVENIPDNLKNLVGQTVLEAHGDTINRLAQIAVESKDENKFLKNTEVKDLVNEIVSDPNVFNREYDPMIIDALDGREYPVVQWARNTIANATKAVKDREIAAMLNKEQRGIDQNAWSNKFAEILGDMTPILAVGAGAGSIASALGASGATAGAVATGATQAATFVDMSGQYAYDTAREYLDKTGDSEFRNFTAKDAKGLSALGYGAIGTMIEFGFGGVEPLIGQAFTKAGIEQGIMKAVGKVAAGEAWEEFLQEWEEFLFRKIDGTNNRTYGQALKDSLQAALWGGLTGGALGGVVYRTNRRNIANILTQTGLDYKDALKVADTALSDLQNNIQENAETALSIKNKTGEPYNRLRVAVDDALKVVEDQGRRVVREEEREEFIDGIVDNWGTFALNQANMLNMTIDDFLSDIQPRFENGEIRMYQPGYMSPQYTYERLQDIEKRISDIEQGIANEAEQEKYNEYKRIANQLRKINAARVARERTAARKAQQQAAKVIESTPKTAVAEVAITETPVVPQGEVATMTVQTEQPTVATTAQPQVQPVAQAQKQRVQDAKKVEKGAYNISGFFNALPATEKAKYQAGETADPALQERFDNALLSWIINDPQLYNQLVVEGDPRGERIVNALRPVAQQFVEFNLTAPTEYRIDDSFRVALGNYITLYTNPNISEFYRSNDMIGQGGFDSNALLYAMRETNTPSGISDFLQAYIDGVVRNQQDTEYGKQARSEILAETIDKSFQSKKGTDQYNSLFTQLQRGAVEPPAPLQDARVPNEYFDLADENARLDDIYPEYKGETIVVDGKERPVYNSEGRHIAKSAEALTNFWRWFGDSGVKYKGRPLVVYHGTNAQFDTFNKIKVAENGYGFYFSSDTGEAGGYGKIMPVYLKINNPAPSYEQFTERVSDEQIQNIVDKYIERFVESKENKQMALDLANTLKTYPKTSIVDRLDGLLDLHLMSDKDLTTDELDLEIRKITTEITGYDGYFYGAYDESGGHENYVAWQPNQIKSVDNRGTYDLQDPNIYYDRSPSQWRGMFNMIRGAIAISGSVKPSTIQHELAHFWLDNMWNRYKSGKYTDAWLSNFQSIAKWLGINLDADYISTPAHEQFARGYEAFISGRTIADVAGLKPAFDRYDRFVRRVYKTARDIRYRDATGHPTNPIFTKEAFDAFDRLLQVPDGVEVATNAELIPQTKEEKDENAKTIKKSIQETRTKIAEAQDQRAKENPSDVPILRTTGYAKDTDGKVKKGKNGYYIVSTQEGQEKKALDLIKSNPQLAESIIWGGANQTDIDRGVLARAYANFIKDTDPAKAELIREYEITTISRSAAKTLSHIPRNDLYRSAARQILAQKTRNLAQANYGLRAGMVEQLEKDLENRIALAWEAVKNAPMAQKQAVAIQQIREIASDFSTVDELPETLADADFTQVNERTFTEIAGAQIRRMLGLTLTQNESDQLDVLVEQIENSMQGESWERQHYLTEETARLLRQYSEFIAGYSPQTMWDKATKLYYPASMLMNLPTHFKNVITNMFQQVASSLSVAGGIAQIEIPLEQLTKDAKYDFNLYLKTGFMPSVMTDITSPQQILGEKRMVLANPNWFDNIAEKSLNVLSVEDAVFKSISFYRELAIIASKQAKKEGLTGKALKARSLELYREGRALRGQTEWGIETRAQASEIAKVDTFVGTNGWTRLARSARNTLNQITIRGRSANIGNILSPFIVVGTNIVRGGFNLTGLPIASGIAIDIFHPQTRINDTKVSELIDLDILSERQAKALFKGGKINQRVARTLIAEGQITEEELKGLTYTERFGGATVRGLSETGFAWLFIIGLMSVLDDDDWMPDYDEATAAEKARAKAQGIQFGSIRFGNTWVSTDLFGYLKYPIHWAMNTRRFGVKSLPQSALNTAAELPVISDVMDLWNQNKYNKTTSDYLRTFGNTIIDKLNGFIPGVVNNAKRILQKSGKLPTLKLKKKGEALETKQTREFDTEDVILYTLFGQAISTEE